MRAIITLSVLAFLTGSATPASAELKSKEVTYKQGGVELQGYLVWDTSIKGKRPGVLVVHEWWGLDDYARKRANMLAKLGYVAFALDMYGKGKIAEHPKQAAAWSSELRKNADAWLKRARAGLEILKKSDLVDDSKIAAIGYCFGGSTVLQLAFAGTPLKGVVTFHGGLSVPDDKQVKRIKSEILVCHGADDKLIKEEVIKGFREALSKGNVDWTMIYYANAKHSFTNPAADKRGIPVLGYNRRADERSWQHMQDFFRKMFE